MHVPIRISKYLETAHINYQLLLHRPSENSLDSAQYAHIPYKNVIKAVILLDHEDRKLMAILPANRKVSFAALDLKLHHTYKMADEKMISKLFNDCLLGAIPPLAEAYHLDVIYDDSLLQLQEIYFEAGDHETLIKLSHDDFRRLMKNAKHMSFSYEFMH
jgi:Ala-tRNA(Pro) deacylase